MRRVVIAGGTGSLGGALARRLADTHRVLALRPPALGETRPSASEAGSWPCDLMSVPDTEVALAGADTVVMLAQARRRPAQWTRAAFDDLDRLMADSVARAVRRCGVQRLVWFACGPDDARGLLLERSGVPVSVLRGGGPDPVAQLAELVDAPAGTVREAETWSGGAPAPLPRRLRVCSVQRYGRPAGWSAEALARAYFEWLPSASPATRVTEREGVFSVTVFGTPALVLRHLPGRSEPDSYLLEVAAGALVRQAKVRGLLEFRVLLDGVTAMAALTGLEPRLPWLLYRSTQALVHERVMRRFGEYLEQQTGALAAR